MGYLENIQCAVCGAPFQPPIDHILPYTSHQEASSSDLSTKHQDWLRHLRIVGRKLKNSHAYVSGVGNASIHDWVSVHVGNDPNAPDCRRSEGVETIDLPTDLDWNSMGGGQEMFRSYPIHCACFGILERVHKIKNPWNAKLDVEALKCAMEKLDSGESHFLGRMEHFELGRRAWEEFWMTVMRLVRDWLAHHTFIELEIIG